MVRYGIPFVAACLSAVFLAGCGGGGGGASLGTGSSSGGTTSNSVAVIVDGGPPVLATLNPPEFVPNALYTSVTICTPGSTTACQTIDHVQVDTGSYGFSVLASVLNGTVTPTPTSVSGGPLRECQQYADGYAWGSIVTVDVTIGQRKLSALPMSLVGDPAAGQAPSDCSTTGTDINLNSVQNFGSNGIIGIGYFLQDCGEACATAAYSPGYYACPVSGCVPTIVPLAQQLQNPIGRLATDNNGALVSLPGASANGQATLSGTLYFGIGTQSNNSAGSASFLTVADGSVASEPAGSLITQFNGSTLTGSVVDSGSNGYFFNDSSLTPCASTSNEPNFYCSSASGLQATLQGVNGTQSPAVVFSVVDAATLFNTPKPLAAFPTLAGPGASFGTTPLGFDWGLPFFFGRNVYILFEGATAGGATGPAVGF